MKYDHGEDFVDWVRSRISDKLGFDMPLGMGVRNENGDIIVGIVLDNYRIESNSICASFAINDKRAATRNAVKLVFNTAFNLIGVNRITVMIERDNEKSQKAVKQLGFRFEGAMKEASYNQKDLFVYGMLKSECKWI